MVSRLAGIVAVLLIGYSLTAHAQSVGASITTSSPQTAVRGGSSMTPGNIGVRGGFVPGGVPPSLTSIGPRTFTPTVPGSGFGRGDFGRRRHHGFGKKFVPIFVPTYSYPYYPYYPLDYYGSDAYSNTGSDNGSMQQEPELPALTIFENRPGYRPPPVVAADTSNYDRSQQASAQPADRSDTEPEPTPAAAQTPTVLVFRDGRHLEIGNYAIQGELLYNLDGKGPRKIKLDDLDLDKTIQANDERGNEFRLPKKYRG